MRVQNSASYSWMLALLLCGLALPPRIEGQETAAASGGYQMSAGYSFLSNSFNGHTTGTSHAPLNGWDVAITYPGPRGLGLKADLSGYYGTSLGSPQRPIFVMGGVQYSRRFGKDTGFAEGLVGVGHLNSDWWGGSAPGGTFSFASAAGGGVDLRMTPRIALRIQGDLQYSNFTIPDDQIHGLPNYFARISTGLVWRF